MMFSHWLNQTPQPTQRETFAWISPKIIFVWLGRFCFATWMREALLVPALRFIRCEESTVSALSQFLMLQVMWYFPGSLLMHIYMLVLECFLGFLATGLIIVILYLLPIATKLLNTKSRTAVTHMASLTRQVIARGKQTDFSPFRRYMASTLDVFTRNTQPGYLQERLRSCFTATEAKESNEHTPRRSEEARREKNLLQHSPVDSAEIREKQAKLRKGKGSGKGRRRRKLCPRTTRSGTVFGYTYNVSDSPDQTDPYTTGV